MTRLSNRLNVGYPNGLISTLFILTFFILLLGSCSKPAGNIGVGIQPEDSKLNLRYTDTATIQAYSFPEDSVNGTFLQWNPLGSLNDPVFGHTNAGFYTQFFLSSLEKDFGEGRVLDSLILQLDYYGIYADTNTAITVHVYEMAEGLNEEETYYSNLQLPIYPGDYGNITFVPDPNDSIVIGEDTLAGVLRLDLSKNNPALAEKLLAADSTDMEDSEVFRDYFQGLFVIAQPVDEGGCIAQFELTSVRSGMTLYYHNNEDDSLSFNYPITTSAVRVSKFEHDFTTADPEFRQQVVEGDSTLGSTKFYLQGFSGVRTVVQIPHISEFRKLGHVALNEAKLVLDGYEPDPLWGAIPTLALYSINDEGANEYLIDYGEGETYFGGNYNTSSNNYVFRITRYLQSLINDTTLSNNGLALYVSSPWVTPHRYIFNGSQSDSTSRLRLEILYTDLD